MSSPETPAIEELVGYGRWLLPELLEVEPDVVDPHGIEFQVLNSEFVQLEGLPGHQVARILEPEEVDDKRSGLESSVIAKQLLSTTVA